MTGYYGADPGQLRALAMQFDKGAGVLESHAMTLHSMIGSSTSWQGPDAERFRSEWTGRDFKAMSAAIQMLRSSARDLQRNADDQERISGGHGGSAADAQSGAAGGASGLFDHIENTSKDHDAYQDGVRIERVVGPDGQTRLIVYFKGQDASANRDGWRSLLMTGGGADPSIAALIDDALKDCPAGKDTEVMLVGFSQGGMDAQNIASSDRYNVSTLVTYGSPITHSDNPHIQTVHLQANSDPVPAIGGYLGGAHGSNQVFHSDADTPWGQLAHSDAAYKNVAADFDNSADPRFADVKKSIDMFNGVVVDSDE